MSTSLCFGNIVLVPFPFTNQDAAKKRPAVVVSTEAYGRKRADVILMPITSKVRDPVATGETPIVAWQAAGLLMPSVVKPVLATLEQRLVLRCLGTLDLGDQASLRQSIGSILG